LPFVVLAGWVFGFFVEKMLAKDKSPSRHPGFQQYERNSGLLFPKVLPTLRAPTHTTSG